MQIEIMTDVRRFEHLRSEWDALAAQQSDVNIFLEFDWIFTWWQYFGKKYDLYLVVVREKEGVVGILPLMIAKRAGFRCLEMIASDLSDFEGLLLSPGKEQEILFHVVEFLRKRFDWDIWRIRRVRQTSYFFAMLKEWLLQLPSGFFSNMQAHKERVLFIKTAGLWSEFQGTLKPKFLSDTRRRNRKLLEEGDIVFEDMSMKPEAQIDLILSQIRSWHDYRRGQKQSGSFLDNDNVCLFFKNIINIFARRQWIRLDVMSCGGKNVAIHLGFYYRKNFHYYLPVFDADYQKFAISRLLLNRLLENCFNSDCEKFDFMLGDELYKFDWNPLTEEIHFLNIAPKTLRGYAAFALFDRIRPWQKKVQGKSW